MQPVSELPAASDTLSFETLVRTLESGLSRNDTLRQNATKQVSEWEKREGYYRFLQDAILSDGTSEDVKAFAATQLKNGLDKFWRRSAVNAIKSAERDKIRSRALESCLKQPNLRVVRLAAICVAKIARVDFPNLWPGLLKELIGYIRALTDPAINVKLLVNTLYTSLEIVKELITLRISRPRQMVEAATPDFVSALMQVYHQNTNVYLEHSQPGVWSPRHPGDTITLSLEANLRILKMLRRLAIHIFQYPHDHNVVYDVWKLSQNQLEQLLLFVNEQNAALMDAQHASLFIRHVKQFLKLHCEMANRHPVSFTFFPDSMPLARLYFDTAVVFRLKQIEATEWRESDYSSFLVFFQLKAMQIQRACLKLAHSFSQPLQYRSGSRKEELEKAKLRLKTELCTDDFQLLMLDSILSNFLIFVKSDFEEWESEAEQWEQREEGDEAVHEREVRPCAEKLLLDILINSKHGSNALKSHLLRRVTSEMRDPSPIKREAALAAIGIAAPCLQEGDFDYGAFVMAVMVPEMKLSDSGQAIIRRRIAIVASQWALLDEKLKRHDKRAVYEIFTLLLDPSDTLNNQAVRITAGKRLEAILHEFEFDADIFAPQVTTVLTRLANLVQEVELTDTKLGLLSTMAILVERIHSAINPYAGDIVTLLEPLWSASSSEQSSHAMKRAIIQVLSSLIKAMTIDSKILHPKLLPIIQNALDRDNELDLLHEDALILWQYMVRYSEPPISPELSSLGVLLVSLLDTADWKTNKILDILKSYILLAPERILDDSLRDQTFISLANFMDSGERKFAKEASCCIALTIRTAQALAGDQGLKVLNQSFHESRLTERMLQIIHLTNQSKRTGAGANSSVLDPQSEQNHFTVFSFMILTNTDMFLQHIREYSSQQGEDEKKTLAWLLEEWFDALDGVVEIKQHKLLMLALTRLFEVGVALDHLQDMLYRWTSVLIELRRDEEDILSDSQVRESQDGAPTIGIKNPEEFREQQLDNTDAVHTVNLPQYVQSLMHGAITQSGTLEAFKEQWFSPLDQNIVQGFLSLGLL